MLNATVVLVIVSSLVGLILTQRAAGLVKKEPARAVSEEAVLTDVPSKAE
jgi:hypothetical protein